MSSARDRIGAVARAAGWEVKSIVWESPRAGPEKSGPEGGWDVYLIREGKEDWAGGYNVEQVIQWIKNFDLPFDERKNPFSCSGSYTFSPDACVLYRGHKTPHETLRQLRASQGIVI